MSRAALLALSLVLSYGAALTHGEDTNSQNRVQQPLPDSEQILADALKQARQEHKRVFFVVTGENCGACDLMSRFLDRHKTIIEKDFIVVKVRREQDAASDAVIRRVRAGKPGGIPWVAILNDDGVVCATSNDAEGKNLGFPHHPEGIERFMKMISSTSRRMTSNQLLELEETLSNGIILREMLEERDAARRKQADPKGLTTSDGKTER